MAVAKVVHKKQRMTLHEIIRYQLATHCYFSKILLSDADLDCLTLLGIKNEMELTEFCKEVCPQSPQTIRNRLARAERIGLVVKKGINRKKISLNPNLQIQTVGNIVLDFKFVYAATT